MDQLLQTPSKISLLALLRDSGAHREALMKVLDQAFVDHDVTVDQFDGIVGNITSCNNLGPFIDSNTLWKLCGVYRHGRSNSYISGTYL